MSTAEAMTVADTAAQADFRRSLRAWLEATVPELPPPAAHDDWTARRAYDTAWQRRLYDAGYAGIDWPVDSGGLGLSAVEQLIFSEEIYRSRAPGVGVGLVGLMHAGPTIAAFGSDELRRRLLPPILRGEQVWCQGFSEPGAGSDLAAIRTSAVREGDEYVVTGQKIWSTHAHVADYYEILVRTDPASTGHRGLTWLAMPMHQPGIDVRQIPTLDGASDFCEVFLDGARCPVQNRVGEENGGWNIAMATLTHERLLAFVGDLIDASAMAADLVAERLCPAELQIELGIIQAELDAAWALLRRNVSGAAHGNPPTYGVSVFKLGFTELANRLGDLLTDSVFPYLLSHDVETSKLERLVNTRLWFLAGTIAGGTSQIQRNVIAERLLGLPREPR